MQQHAAFGSAVGSPCALTTCLSRRMGFDDLLGHKVVGGYADGALQVRTYAGRMMLPRSWATRAAVPQKQMQSLTPQLCIRLAFVGLLSTIELLNSDQGILACTKLVCFIAFQMWLQAIFCACQQNMLSAWKLTGLGHHAHTSMPYLPHNSRSAIGHNTAHAKLNRQASPCQVMSDAFAFGHAALCRSSVYHLHLTSKQ